jgi:hypothetical protein
MLLDQLKEIDKLYAEWGAHARNNQLAAAYFQHHNRLANRLDEAESFRRDPLRNPRPVGELMTRQEFTKDTEARLADYLQQREGFWQPIRDRIYKALTPVVEAIKENPLLLDDAGVLEYVANTWVPFRGKDITPTPKQVGVEIRSRFATLQYELNLQAQKQREKENLQRLGSVSNS